ncbi:MAG: hypothetical protein ACP5N6_14430, partial [Anaerolineae bacterium]
DGQYYPTFGDDAYISMRYARHLREGRGLVWNVGEKPIEGYTNFLWVVWIAVLMLFIEDPSFLMIASGAALHALSVAFLYLFLRKAFRCHLGVAALAACLLAVWEPIRIQVLNGLEAPMLLFLFIVAVYFLFGDSTNKLHIFMGSFLAGLLPLVRPDGLIFLIIVLAGLASHRLFQATKAFKETLKRWKWVLLCFVMPTVLLTLFRISYFGEWLPNTYYLKVYNRPGHIEYGIAYVQRFLNSFYATPLIVPLVVYGLFEKRRYIGAMALGIIGNLAYVAYQGGDAWDWWRFMIPILPMILITLASLSERCKVSKPLYATALAIWVMIAFSGVRPVWTAIQQGSIFPKPISQTADNIRLGLLLSRVCQPDTYTADFWAGAAPFYSRLPSIDMLGKSDWHIARLPAYRSGAPPGHDKFDFEYVLSRRPDVIISNHPLKVTPEDLQGIKQSNYPFGAILLENKLFQENYIPVDSIISYRWHGIFARRDSDKCAWWRLPVEELALLGKTCLAFPEGWYGLEQSDQVWWRWTDGRGRIKVIISEDTGVLLSGGVFSIRYPNRVDILLNNERVETLSLDQSTGDFRPFDLSLPLRAGINVIEFVSHNPAITIPTDSRPLAIAVRNLRLQTEGGQTCELQP